MPIVRRDRSDIDLDKLRAEFLASPEPTEADIDRQAVEDGNAWTDDDVARSVLVNPPPTAEQRVIEADPDAVIRALGRRGTSREPAGGV